MKVIRQCMHHHSLARLVATYLWAKLGMGAASSDGLTNQEACLLRSSGAFIQAGAYSIKNEWIPEQWPIGACQDIATLEQADLEILYWCK